MIKPILYACAVFGIVACGHTANRITPPSVVVVEKKIMVPVKCINELPSAPALDPIPATGITEQTIARVKREQQLIEYGNKLKLLSSPCIEEPK